MDKHQNVGRSELYQSENVKKFGGRYSRINPTTFEINRKEFLTIFSNIVGLILLYRPPNFFYVFGLIQFRPTWRPVAQSIARRLVKPMDPGSIPARDKKIFRVLWHCPRYDNRKESGSCHNRATVNLFAG